MSDPHFSPGNPADAEQLGALPEHEAPDSPHTVLEDAAEPALHADPEVAFGPSPPPPPPLPPVMLTVDRAPDAPALISVEPHSMSVQWNPASITVHSKEIRVVEYLAAYRLEMQQLDAAAAAAPGGAAAAVRPDRWSVQYAGPATYVQVKGLRAGRTYAVRVTCEPVVTDPDVVVRAAAASELVVVATPAIPPSAPHPLGLAVRQRNMLKFKWPEPEETGGRPVLEYVLECHPPPLGHELPPTREGMYELYRGPERSAAVKRLMPGVTYTARVQAINCVGEGPFTAAVVFTTQATVPSTPEAPVPVNCTQDAVVLTWPAVAGNGADVSGYSVEMDDGAEGGFRFVGHSVDPAFSVAGLRSGVAYLFRVRAENAEGRGQWSPLCEARTAATPPLSLAPPAAVAATHSSITLAWRPPEYDGGSPVVRYEVEAEPKCAAAKQEFPDEWVLVYHGPDPTCTLGGLRAGCTYRARVRAVNAQGPGACSHPADVSTSPACPEPPGAPAPTARHTNALALAWPPSPHDGGAPIVVYRLEGCFVGRVEELSAGQAGRGKAPAEPRFEPRYSGLDCRAEVRELEAGARYQFRVAAANRQGSSAWTRTVVVETKPGLPFPPDGAAVSAGAAPGSLRLAWARPYGQGAPVNSYIVQACTVQALQHASRLADAAAAPAAAPALDDAEQMVEGAAAGKKGAATGAGQADPVDSAFQTVYHGADSSCTVGDLEPDTEYAFRLKACSGVGASAWSVVQAHRTPAAAPTAPHDLRADSAAAGPTHVNVAWAAPARTHGSPVALYQLDYAPAARGQRAGSAAWRTAYQGADPACVLRELHPGRQYSLRVRASNACGWGPWTPAAGAATAPDVPAAPAAPAFAGRTGTSVRVKWAPPLEDHGAAVARYEVQVAPGGSDAFAPAWSGEETSFRADQLAPGAAHAFRVRACNAVGWGPWSPAAGVTTSLAPPLPPAALTTALSDSSPAAVALSWRAPPGAPLRAACISYELEAAPAPRPPGGERPSSARAAALAQVVRQTCGARATEHRLSGLQAGCEYAVRVRSIGADGAGHGDWSAPVVVTTPSAPEPAHEVEPSSAAPALADGPATKSRRGRRASANGEAVASGVKLQRPSSAGANKGVAKTLNAKKRPWYAFLAKMVGVHEADLPALIQGIIILVLIAGALVFGVKEWGETRAK